MSLEANKKLSTANQQKNGPTQPDNTQGKQNPSQPPPSNPSSQTMGKSPSTTSTTSNTSAGDPNKFSPNLFNMFGTNVPVSNPPQNVQPVQPVQQPMPKQNIMGTGVTSPVAKNTQAADSFANIW